jgi:hypothetical protein
MLHLQHNTTRTSQASAACAVEKPHNSSGNQVSRPHICTGASTDANSRESRSAIVSPVESSLELPPQSEQRPSQTLLHGNTTAEFVTIPLPLRHNSTATTRRRSTKTRLLPRLSRSRALSSTHLDSKVHFDYITTLWTGPATILEQMDAVDLQHSYLDSKVLFNNIATIWTGPGLFIVLFRVFTNISKLSLHTRKAKTILSSFR